MNGMAAIRANIGLPASCDCASVAAIVMSSTLMRDTLGTGAV